MTERDGATIYHNPACGTSRTVLAALRAAGYEPTVVAYLETPPDRATLERVLAKMGKDLREILRKRGTPFEDLGLGAEGVTDDAIFAAIAAHPVLIERAALCRPAETVQALIG